MTIMTTFVGAMKNKMIQNSSWSFLLVRCYLEGKIFYVNFSLCEEDTSTRGKYFVFFFDLIIITFLLFCFGEYQLNT